MSKRASSKPNEMSRQKLKDDHALYCETVLTFLETMTRVKWSSDQERTLFRERLLRYPKWRLLKLDNYTGAMSNALFRYLDDLQPDPEDPRSELGDYNRKQIANPPNTELAKDMREYVDQMVYKIGDEMTEEDKKAFRRWQLCELERLHAKYPHIGLEKLMTDKRFEDL